MAMSAAPARVASAGSSALSAAKLEVEGALSVSSNFTLKEVSKRMLQFGVEKAFVIDSVREVVRGVVTSLDIMRSMAAKGWMSPFLQITKVIKAATNVAKDDDGVDALREILTTQSRLLPVDGISAILGELTLGDILLEETSYALEEEESMSSAALAITKARKAVMVVKEGEGVGIMTPGIMMLAVVEGLDFEDTTVADVMIREIETWPRAKTVVGALEEMRTKNSQHVLVEADDGGGVARVVSAEDIVGAIAGGPEKERMEALCKGVMETLSEEEAEGAPESAVVEEPGSDNTAVSDSEPAPSERVSDSEPVPSERVSDSEPVSDELLILPCDRTVKEVVRQMALKRADVVLLAERGRVVGMFTYRDLTCRVVALGKRPDQTAVKDVMSPIPGLMMAPVMSAGLDGSREAGTVGGNSKRRSEAVFGSRPEEGLFPTGLLSGRSISIGVGLAAIAGMLLLPVMRCRR